MVSLVSCLGHAGLEIACRFEREGRMVLGLNQISMRPQSCEAWISCYGEA